MGQQWREAGNTGGEGDGATGPHLNGKRAVVTGGASGIGAAIGSRLVAAGANVVLVDHAESVLDTARRIGAEPVMADLADPDEAGAVGAGADVLVNNAGVQYVAPVHEFPPQTFARLLTIMVESPFRAARAALPTMYARGWGRVINVSSVQGLRGAAFCSAYVAAKHGLEGLSKTIALEAAGRGVTSNCLCPGYVRTPLVERQAAEQAVLYRVPTDEVIEDVLLAHTPVKRLVEPDEVADLAVWLCGPGTASVTGASFPMDGGWTAH